MRFLAMLDHAFQKKVQGFIVLLERGLFGLQLTDSESEFLPTLLNFFKRSQGWCRRLACSHRDNVARDGWIFQTHFALCLINCMVTALACRSFFFIRCYGPPKASDELLHPTFEARNPITDGFFERFVI